MASYSYYRKIIVDNTKVGETDSGFAVLLNLTANGSGILADLRTVGNGGKIQNTDAAGGASGAYTVPADLTFRTTADPTQAGANLDFEIEFYDAATGALIVWVQSGVIVDTDADIYMVYGNADVTTSQENVAGTWDADFKGVWHLGEGSGTAYDSTSNNNHGTNVGSDDATGKIGKGREFIAANDDRIQYGDVLDVGSSDFTIEGWVYPDAGGVFVSKFWGVDGERSYNVQLGNYFTSSADGSSTLVVASNTGVSYGSWQRVAVVKSGTTLTWYLNGSPDGSGTVHATLKNNANYFCLGAQRKTDGTIGGEIDGILDEVRVSFVARSANYVTTCFNNQSSPSTFYSVGSEQEINYQVNEGAGNVDVANRGDLALVVIA